MVALRKSLEPLEVHIVPMRRRHLRAVLRIEPQVYPRPWSHSLFVSELALRSTRAYVVAKVGRDVVGYAGLDDVAHRRSRHDDRGRPRLAPARRRHAPAARARARGDRARRDRAHARSPAVEQAARRRCTSRFGFAPVGVRKGYYADTGEDALVMWAYEVDTPAYAQLLERRRGTGPRHDRLRTTEVLVTPHPRDRDVVRRDRGGGRRRRSRRAVVGRVEPGRSARALRRRRSRDREPRARRADRRRHRAGARRSGRRRSPTSTRSPRCTVPGLAGALLVGVSAAKAIALATGPAVRRRQPSRSARVRGAARGPDARTAVAHARSCRAGTRCSSRWTTTASTACSARPSTTPRARRSTRSRASSGSAIRAVPRSIASRATATRPRSRSRARCSTTATTSRSRA